MSRYFLEVRYLGLPYAGFQIQQNANTVQSEVERAMEVFFREKITLTGSSRTDTGVHARQNYFHFDREEEIRGGSLYNLNALLPPGIAAVSLRKMRRNAHCRFDAVAREYLYRVYAMKDPFMAGFGYYFPYRVDIDAMHQAAAVVMEYEDFTSFAKRKAQVKTNICKVVRSEWVEEAGCLEYRVKANRFLRGMVRGLVGTMLQVGRGKLRVHEFRRVIEGRDAALADFSVPGHGLYLMEVEFPQGYFEEVDKK